jgi:hypothetical protein
MYDNSYLGDAPDAPDASVLLSNASNDWRELICELFLAIEGKAPCSTGRMGSEVSCLRFHDYIRKRIAKNWMFALRLNRGAENGGDNEIKRNGRNDNARRKRRFGVVFILSTWQVRIEMK